MTYERQFCVRCTNVHFCVMVGSDFYCQNCFDTVVNDPETKENIAKIMLMSNIENIESEILGKSKN